MCWPVREGRWQPLLLRGESLLLMNTFSIQIDKEIDSALIFRAAMAEDRLKGSFLETERGAEHFQVKRDPFIGVQSEQPVGSLVVIDSIDRIDSGSTAGPVAEVVPGLSSGLGKVADFQTC